MASKHRIYLTKTKQINAENYETPNVFMFNENGPKIAAQWVKKTIDLNNGAFVILDHKNIIHDEVERSLTRRNYYIEKVDFSKKIDDIKINPFDLVKNTSEIHYMFLNFLYSMWDNTDPDITAMSNLIDAFASCTHAIFKDNPSKLNMATLKKMVGSVRATCQTANGVVSLSDAIFGEIRDQESMPCKYYAQFKKAAGERIEEISEKVATLFDMFTEADFSMMESTDDSLVESFNFKTAFFVNVNSPEEEHSAKLLITLLYYFLQNSGTTQSQTMFILDDLNAIHTLVNLPYWMKEANDFNISFIVINDDLTEFKNSPRSEKFFRNIQKATASSVLVHHNDTAIKYNNSLPSNEDEMNEMLGAEYIATVLIPSDGINEQDELI